MEKANKYVLSENCIIDLNRRCVTVDGKTERLSEKEYMVLLCLLKSANTTVSKEILLEKVWGDAYYTADNCQRVRDTVKILRKKFPPLKKLIITVRGDDSSGGYRIDYDDTHAFSDNMPHVLTFSIPAFISEDKVLHREKETGEIKSTLLAKKSTLLLSGMGGIGKTVTARLVYFCIEKQFDHVGWINYHGDLQSSMLSDLTIEEGIENCQKRWQVISRMLKNCKKRILLVIDNVDVDLSVKQDPLKDKTLQEISGWTNVTVLLTSRLTELQGYTTCRLEHLSPDACEDLFYYYCPLTEHGITPEEDEDWKAIQSLVSYAGYNSFAIELLAKSTKYASSLQSYAQEIRKTGFQFPPIEVHTEYQSLYGDAASQLRKLFNLGTRSPLEQQILWDFSILPSMGLSIQETKMWLNYTASDMDRLISEGWLQYRDGFFSMQPLVRESVSIDYQNGKAPEGTASSLINCIIAGSFFVNTGYPEIDLFNATKSFEGEITDEILAEIASQKIRQYEIALYVTQHLSLKDEQSFSVQMRLCLHAAKELSEYEAACNHFRKGFAIYHKLPPEQKWNKELDYVQKELERTAAFLDYKGYYHSVYSGDIFWINHELAVSYFGNALLIHETISDVDPSDSKCQLAWANYYFGFYLMICNYRPDEAKQHLEYALRIWKERALINIEKHATEISGVYCNLSKLYILVDMIEKAEEQLKSALSVLEQAETICPGKYALDLALCYTNIAILIWHKHGKQHNIELMLNLASSIIEEAERDYRDSLMAKCVDLFCYIKRYERAYSKKNKPNEPLRLLKETIALLRSVKADRIIPESFSTTIQQNISVLERSLMDQKACEVYFQGRFIRKDLEGRIRNDKEFEKMVMDIEAAKPSILQNTIYGKGFLSILSARRYIKIVEQRTKQGHG